MTNKIEQAKKKAEVALIAAQKAYSDAIEYDMEVQTVMAQYGALTSLVEKALDTVEAEHAPKKDKDALIAYICKTGVKYKHAAKLYGYSYKEVKAIMKKHKESVV